MKVRNTGRHDDKIELQMTPMIDIVFQLLVFFIMTFKIVIPEGDFNIKMPLAAPSAGPPEESLALQVKLVMKANSDGSLSGMEMNQQSVGSFTALHNKLMSLVGGDSGPDSLAANTEVEIQCSENLKFQYVIQAITEVTGKIVNGRPIKMIEKIKFAPPLKAT